MKKILVILCLAISGGAANAQQWPGKPVRWIVPYAPGGFADIRARKMGVDLAKALGQPVVIENRAGAGGTVVTDAVAKAPADGYTIGSGNLASMSVNVSLMKKLPYDPLKDLQPVMLIERSALILVAGPGLKANSVQELIAYAKANPGKVGFGSSGIGGAHHLSGEMLKLRTGIDIVHIPYKGGGQAIADVASGQVKVGVLGMAPSLPHIQSGKLIALAVTGGRRSPLLPDVPTVAEAALPGFETVQWQGIAAPAGTPPEIVGRIHDELVRIMGTPAVVERLKSIGMDNSTSPTPDDFRKLIDDDLHRWPAIVKAAGIEPE